MTMESTSSLRALAAQISAHADTLSTFYETHNFAPPSPTDPSSGCKNPLPNDAPEEAINARRDILEATRTLETTVQGPSETLRLLIQNFHDTATLGTIVRLRIPESVPLDGSISFRELAAKVGVLEPKLAQILRYAFTNYIFQECRAGYVSHTAISTLIAQPNVSALVYLITAECLPSPAAFINSFVEYPYSDSPSRTAYNLGFGHKKMFFESFMENPERVSRFNKAMKGYTQLTFEGMQADGTEDVEAFPWDILGKGAKLVDVAGGSGHISCAIATAYPNLEVVVQDLPQVIAESQAKLVQSHPELKGRVSYMAHDMFSEQPVKGADAYYFRKVIHDWPKAECVKILRSLLPALKPGARVLVSDYVLPPPGQLTKIQDKLLRQWDLTLLTIANAKERYREEFKELFSLTSPDLVFNKEHKARSDSAGSIFEAIYKPSGSVPATS